MLLQGFINSGDFCRMGVLSEQIHPFQQEVNQVTVEYAIVIVEIMGNIHPDDDFLKEVAGKFQGIQFGGFFLSRAHLEGGLDIQLPVTVVDNKINLFLDIAAVSSVHYNTHIHAISPTDQIIVDDILHDVTRIILPIIQTGIPQTNICVVILVGIVEVGLSLDVIPLGHAD